MSLAAAVTFEDSDDDPVIAEYSVFITPELQEQIYLLQYPNRSRSQPYNETNHAKPREVRIKPNSGFMEIDISTTVFHNFDKSKGAMWGEALKTAEDSGVAAFGIASGFGKGARGGDLFTAERVRGRRAGGGAQNQFAQFEDAVEQGKILNKQTLGGQIIPSEPGKPLYMIGTFRGDELHLTEVTGTAQLRPQFHHIDAQSQITRSKFAHHKAAREPPRNSEPKVVQQVAKALGANGEEFQFTQTSEFLTQASEERWTKLRYVDEETDEAYNVYNEKLFVKDTAHAPRLQSALNNDQYVDAISAPKIDATSRTKRKPLTKKERIEQQANESEAAVSASKGKAPEGQATAGAAGGK